MLSLDLTGRDLDTRNKAGRTVPKAPCHVWGPTSLSRDSAVKPVHFGTSKAQYSVGLVHPSPPDVNYVFFRPTFGDALPSNGCMVSKFRLVDFGSNNNLPCSLSLVSVSFILLLAVVSRLAGLTSPPCLFLSTTVVQMDPKNGILSG